MKWIQSLSYEEQKKLWVCNDKIARQNAERFAHMDLRNNLTQALLAYDGIQYAYMAPAVFEDGQYEYVQEHLTKEQIARAYGVDAEQIDVIAYEVVNSIKITFPRKHISGSLADDDIYGCQHHMPLAQMMI